MDNKELQLTPIRPISAPHSNVQHYVTEESVCTKEICFAVDNGSIDYVDFGGGCEGNLKGIANMIEGMSVDFVLNCFSGITCGDKSTSCVDQLCTALTEHMEKKSVELIS